MLQVSNKQIYLHINPQWIFHGPLNPHDRPSSKEHKRTVMKLWCQLFGGRRFPGFQPKLRGVLAEWPAISSKTIHFGAGQILGVDCRRCGQRWVLTVKQSWAPLLNDRAVLNSPWKANGHRFCSYHVVPMMLCLACCHFAGISSSHNSDWEAFFHVRSWCCCLLQNGGGDSCWWHFFPNFYIINLAPLVLLNDLNMLRLQAFLWS